MASSKKASPRQKMINLIYIVLMAMLVLNVSSDVLNGFKLVEDSLSISIDNMTLRNNSLYQELAILAKNNPGKAGIWYQKATVVKRTCDSLFNYTEDLKQRIVKKADGEKGNVDDIQSRDNLEAASYIMLSPVEDQGKQLKNAIDNYKNTLCSLLDDPLRKKAIEAYLDTKVPENAPSDGTSWQSAMFENMPVSAAITILTKLQSDFRYAEREAIGSLMNSVDRKDIRVNQMNAFVIPNSKHIIRGGKYSANIVLAAIDSTNHPNIFIGGRKLNLTKDGLFEMNCNTIGNFNLQGYIELPHSDGTVEKHNFSSPYTVVEPSATISATMMNVMYAGINNPVSISVPGIPSSQIQATMSNGTLTRSGNEWIAKPVKIGQEAVINVTTQMEGRVQTVAKLSFRVRKLPDPKPFISYKDEKGNLQTYKGGIPLFKSYLLSADGIEAAIDDDLLNVKFRVISFETVFFDSMGNALPELSNGEKFSQRQTDAFRRLSKGKRFYISRVKAIGPDGVERTISPIEVLIN